MKNNKTTIIGWFIASLLLVTVGCQPIEDREYLENSTDVAGVELFATQSTPGGNEIELNMTTPGVTGYWNYNLGNAYSDKAEFIYPIPGTATFTFVGTLGAEFFSKTIEVQVDNLDHALDQDWYDLVSEDLVLGKTWVFDGGPDPDGGLWWYMADPTSWESLWWNAAGECCPPSDAAGRMTFDLDGAANFTYYSGPDAAPEVGSYVLNVGKQTLKINNGNILGIIEKPGEPLRGNPDGLYQIISLTEDQLILFVANNEGGTGWTWVFRPE